jgi:hypothetical protein
MTINCQIYKNKALLLFEYKFSYNEVIFIAITKFFFIKITLMILKNYELFIILRNTTFSSLMQIEKAKIKKAQI